VTINSLAPKTNKTINPRADRGRLLRERANREGVRRQMGCEEREASSLSKAGAERRPVFHTHYYGLGTEGQF